MIAVISAELEKVSKEKAQNLPLPVKGYIREGEDVLRIIYPDEVNPPLIPLYQKGKMVDGWLATGAGFSDAKALFDKNANHDDPCFIMLVRSQTKPLECYYRKSAKDEPEICDIELIHLETDLFSRIKGIFDTNILSPKTVAVIGLGSGGSLGALELAKCGVGNFILVDFDRLWPHNITRHTCGLSDVGRFKTRAVRDLILDRNPQASVQCYEADICEDDDLLEKVVGASDLVFVATDTELPKHLINETCLKYRKPAIYGGAYERAFAGEVIRVIPGQTACYACVRHNMADTMRAIDGNRVFDYTAEEEDFKPEPGLGVDVGMIILLQVKLALLTLLRGSDSTLEDIEHDMIIWGNSARPQDSDLFDKPMKRYFVKTEPVPDCPICNPDNFCQGDEG